MLILSFTMVFPCYATMKKSKQSGREWGEQHAVIAFDNRKKFNSKELLPKELKNQTFDAKKAAADVKHGFKTKSETVDFLMSQGVQNNQRQKLFQEDELFIKASEKVFKGTEREISEYLKEEGFIYHTCKQGGDPILISTERSLNVNVNKIPEKLAKICLGHTDTLIIHKKYSIEETSKRLKRKYKNDATIKSESIEVTFLYGHPTSHHYYFKIYYEHEDNFEGCGKCKDKKIHEESYEEIGEEWIYDNQKLWDLAKSLDSTIIEHICIDNTPEKKVNGKRVQRQCWKEKISYLYQVPATNDCHFLKAKNCEQIRQECVQYQSSVCTQWQLTFRCTDKISLNSVSFDGDDKEEGIDYPPNQSFSEVTAKLAVFDEVKKEMENSQSIDVRNLEIFKGKKMSCSKNIADKLMYDCCFNYSGLAKQLGLTKCSSDEISLSEMRENGLCHYVGNYEEKVLDLWKSRDEHVFCCFPSKLSRIVQEQGRKQLGIQWGMPEEPNCRGFTTQELSRINFSKMDLSEICKDFVKQLPKDMPNKLKNFQDRLKKDIEQSEVKK